MVDGKLDQEMVKTTVMTAIRMLDNVIDINYYPTPETQAFEYAASPYWIGYDGLSGCVVQNARAV